MPVRRSNLLSIAALTALIVSFLLFSLQLYVGKVLLPQVGGTPAVWNTTMLFFQAVMLAGYSLTHYLSTRASPSLYRVVILLLGGVGAVFCSSLALVVSYAGSTEDPTIALLGVLFSGLFLPALFLCSISTTLQMWLSGVVGSDSKALLRIYAWSNFGSFLALAAYPLIIEPSIPLSIQREIWPYIFVACLALLALLAIFSLGDSSSNESNSCTAPVPFGQCITWLAISAVPTALFMGSTAYLTTDIAAFPLLWAIPLAIFLLGGTIGFAGISPSSIFWIRRLACLIVIPLLIASAIGASHPPALLMGLHMLFLLLASTVAFGTLYNLRPTEPAQLSTFYLMLAIGGVLAGIWSAILAPLTFALPIEYPLAMIAFCVISPERITLSGWSAALLAAITAALPTLFATLLATPLGSQSFDFEPSLLYIIPALLAFRIFRQPAQFSVALLALYLVPSLSGVGFGSVSLVERNFFGVLRVVEDKDAKALKLYHGTTVHGLQLTSERDRCVPRAYYSERSPLGQFMKIWERPKAASVAAVGLGTGVVACYARADESWDFFEINPAVLDIAKNPNYFSYLANTPTRTINHIVGDARLTLAEKPTATYNLLILDAFSSDSIPVHLLTKEAFALYRSKLNSDGIILIHVSNKFLDIKPIVARQAAELDLLALSLDDTLRIDEHDAALDLPSQWMVLAQPGTPITNELQGVGWKVQASDGAQGWSDDFSNVIELLLIRLKPDHD